MPLLPGPWLPSLFWALKAMRGMWTDCQNSLQTLGLHIKWLHSFSSLPSMCFVLMDLWHLLTDQHSHFFPFSGNHQPVSLITAPGKITEHIHLEALLSHIENREMIQDSQHGFSKGRSCQTSLMVFIDRVAQSVGKGYRCHPSALLYGHSYGPPLTWSFCLKIRRNRDLVYGLLGE